MNTNKVFTTSEQSHHIISLQPSWNIINREFIGKTSDELVAKWNEDHSDDQVSSVD